MTSVNDFRAWTRTVTKIALPLRASRILGLAVAITFVLTWFPGYAGAAEISARQIEPALELSSADMWISPQEPIHLAVTPVAPSTAELRVRLYGDVTDRAGFIDALSGDLGDVRENFGPFPIEERGSVSLPPLDPSAPLPQGVYPIVVELVAGSRLLADVLTFVVSVEPSNQMNAGLAIMTDPEIPIAYQPDGSIDLQIPDELRSLVPSAEALSLNLSGEAVDAMGNTRNSVREALSDFELMTSTYVPIEPHAWLDANAESQLNVQLDEGRESLERVAEGGPAPVWVAEPSATPQSLSWLSQHGVDGFVVREDQLRPLFGDAPVWSTGPFTISTPGVDVVAVSIEDALGQHLEKSDRVAAAQHLLADMAVMMLSGESDDYGFAIDAPDPAHLEALLTQIDRSPYVDTTSIGELIDATPLMSATPDSPGRALVRTLDPSTAEPIGTLPVAILFANAAIRTFEQILGDVSGPIESMERNILVGSAADLDGATRDEYFDQVYADIDEATTGIQGPMDQTITLTGRTQTVPYTISNDLGYQANVLLVFESDSLDFPDGATVEQKLETGVNELDLRVHARSSGDAVLQMTVRSPDATRQLATSRVRVRSTVFSGLGVVISVVALAVLLIWWAREIIGSRRTKTRTTVRAQHAKNDNTGDIDAPGTAEPT